MTRLSKNNIIIAELLVINKANIKKPLLVNNVNDDIYLPMVMDFCQRAIRGQKAGNCDAVHNKPRVLETEEKKKLDSCVNSPKVSFNDVMRRLAIVFK